MIRLLLATLSLVAFSTCSGSNSASPAPFIEVSPLTVDFGEVATGTAATPMNIQVKNLGRTALILQPVQTDNAYFSGPADALEVGSDQTVTIPLGFTPSVPGAQTAIVHLLSNAENAPDVEINVSGLGASSCGTCNTPPAGTCLSDSTATTYAATGTCTATGCEYQLMNVVCGISCDSSTGKCRMPVIIDAGVGDDFDAGMPLADGDFTAPGEYQFTVPAGITSINVKVWGGGGSGGNQNEATGGGAAYVRATLAVTPGEMLAIQVAEGGAIECGAINNCKEAGNGGGASLILRASTPLLIAAGGGGGGSTASKSNRRKGGRGGAGGGLVGQAGQDELATEPNGCFEARGGQGGTQSAGGLGGAATATLPSKHGCVGQPGVSLAGGRSTFNTAKQVCDDQKIAANGWHQGGGTGNGQGGGGGSGYFGGGGAGFIYASCAGGGGGGSSFVDPSATNIKFMDGRNQFQGNAGDSAGAGRGGEDSVLSITQTMGGNGRIALFN